MPYSLLSKMVLAWREFTYRFAPKIKVASTEETLKEIRKNKKCVCRFGDGELSFALNLEKIGHQKENQNLRNRLLKILETGSNDNCLVCIPLALYSFKDFNWKSCIFWFKYGALYRGKFQAVLNPNHRYYDSQISRVYINRKKQTSKYFDMWKEIWKDKSVLIVEGEKTRFGSDNDLFLQTSKFSRILCPPESAYDYYDEILAEVKNKCAEYDLVLIALGITATVLVWDLSKLGVWAIDIGNMDNEYEWFKLGVKKPVPLKNRYVYEAKDGRNVEEMNTSKYLNQIIARVGV